MLTVLRVGREQTIHELDALRQKSYPNAGFQVDVFLKPPGIRRDRQQHNHHSSLLLCLETSLLYPAAEIRSAARRAAEHRMPFPILRKTIILRRKELLTLGVFGSSTGIEGEMIFVVEFPEEFVGGFPLS